MKKKIAIIPIKGPIFGGSSMIPMQTDIITTVTKYIDKAESSDDIRGIVFEIDSPGGSPYQSKKLARMVSDISKPTVARVEENCLSGAYWVAVNCNKIVADELSRIGGIGTAGIRFDLSNFLSNIGVQVKSFSTGKFKEMGMPFNPFGDEEKRVIDNEINMINDMFIKEVSSKRHIDEPIIRLKEGKYFFGADAKSIGLVDCIGGRKEAVNLCKNLSGVQGDIDLIDFGKESKDVPANDIAKMFKNFLGDKEI